MQHQAEVKISDGNIELVSLFANSGDGTAFRSKAISYFQDMPLINGSEGFVSPQRSYRLEANLARTDFRLPGTYHLVVGLSYVDSGGNEYSFPFEVKAISEVESNSRVLLEGGPVHFSEDPHGEVKLTNLDASSKEVVLYFYPAMNVDFGFKSLKVNLSGGETRMIPFQVKATDLLPGTYRGLVIAEYEESGMHYSSSNFLELDVSSRSASSIERAHLLVNVFLVFLLLLVLLRSRLGLII
jgi:hypothetical protein